MISDKELSFFRSYLNACNLQSFIIGEDEIISEKIDMGLRHLLGNTDNTESFNDFFPDAKADTVYRVSDSLFITYIFFRLPFYDNKKIFITGPYLNTDITIDMIKSRSSMLNISTDIIKKLELYYSSIPTIKEEHLIFAGINTFAGIIFNNSFKNTDIKLERSGAFIPSFSKIKQISEDNSVEFAVFEDRYKFENELIDAVARGDSTKAELMMSRFSLLSFENRTPDLLRNTKNYCIIMNTLLRKAAEKGGVHPYYLNKLSSDFAIKTELMSSVRETGDFMLTMMRTYCNLVKNHSLKSYSPIIQQAILKIENNLSSDLSLAVLSKESNVSSGYFSSLFKKETGYTLTEYVNRKRTDYAKHLLKTTSLQIQSVAQLCGILDFHYFCRIFKKYTGITPTQFRSSILFDE